MREEHARADSNRRPPPYHGGCLKRRQNAAVGIPGVVPLDRARVAAVQDRVLECLDLAVARSCPEVEVDGTDAGGRRCRVADACCTAHVYERKRGEDQRAVVERGERTKPESKNALVRERRYVQRDAQRFGLGWRHGGGRRLPRDVQDSLSRVIRCVGLHAERDRPAGRTETRRVVGRSAADDTSIAAHPLTATRRRHRRT